MQIVTVEVENVNGFHLLQELEKLNVLKIINESPLEIKPKLSDKYKGVFSKEDTENFIQHTNTMRKEWDNI